MEKDREKTLVLVDSEMLNGLLSVLKRHNSFKIMLCRDGDEVAYFSKSYVYIKRRCEMLPVEAICLSPTASHNIITHDSYLPEDLLRYEDMFISNDVEAMEQYNERAIMFNLPASIKLPLHQYEICEKIFALSRVLVEKKMDFAMSLLDEEAVTLEGLCVYLHSLLSPVICASVSSDKDLELEVWNEASVIAFVKKLYQDRKKNFLNFVNNYC